MCWTLWPTWNAYSCHFPQHSCVGLIYSCIGFDYEVKWHKVTFKGHSLIALPVLACECSTVPQWTDIAFTVLAYSSERSCRCLKWYQWAMWSVRVEKCGWLWSSERSCLCLKCLDDAGNPACIKGEHVVAESTGLQFRFHIFLVSPNKRLWAPHSPGQVSVGKWRLI